MRLTDEDVQRHKENIYSVECIRGKVKMSDGDIIHNLCDTIEALRLENQQLQKQVVQSRKALTIVSDYYSNVLNMAAWKTVKEALAAIDKIGGREDA